MELAVKDIKPMKTNARKVIRDNEFELLKNSIKRNGVLQPVLVQKIGKNYRLVAGDRRMAAASDLKMKKIPVVVVKGSSNATAHEIMLIENMHRKNLTPLEEAQSFKEYIDTYGESKAAYFAEQIDTPLPVLRRRMALLKLPKEALALYHDKIVNLDHLEQIMRIGDGEAVSKLCDRIRSQQTHGQITSKWISGQINNYHEYRLDDAKFDKSGCTNCAHNSSVQKKLWNMDEVEGGKCVNKPCFIEKQEAALNKGWKKSQEGKEYGTNGVVIYGDGRRYGGQSFGANLVPDPKCKRCKHFVSVCYFDGRNMYEQICSDDGDCYDLYAAAQHSAAAAAAKAQATPAARQTKQEARRQKHGTEFREQFYTNEIPKAVSKISAWDDRFVRIGLASIIVGNPGLFGSHGVLDAQEFGGKTHAGVRGYNWTEKPTPEKITAKVMRMDKATVADTLKKVVTSLAVDGMVFDAGSRHSIGRLMGIDIKSGWKLDREYLEKKYKAEIIELINELGIINDQRFVDHITNKFNGNDAGNLKKNELVNAILECGIDLTGMTPKEIFDA